MGMKKKFGESSFAAPPTMPVGFRFNPTDVELLAYYLRRMLGSMDIAPGIIHRVNVYGFDPRTLTETYEATTENKWYFFTPRGPRYPKGSRPDRRATNGFWKATSAFQNITSQGQLVGYKRSLVFHLLQANSDYHQATKTNWIMHEYGLSKRVRFDSCVLCRIYCHGKKKQISTSDSDVKVLDMRSSSQDEVVSALDGNPPISSLLPAETSTIDFSTYWPTRPAETSYNDLTMMPITTPGHQPSDDQFFMPAAVSLTDPPSNDDLTMPDPVPCLTDQTSYERFIMHAAVIADQAWHNFMPAPLAGLMAQDVTSSRGSDGNQMSWPASTADNSSFGSDHTTLTQEGVMSPCDSGASGTNLPSLTSSTDPSHLTCPILESSSEPDFLNPAIDFTDLLGDIDY